jgi:hypothetical protein
MITYRVEGRTRQPSGWTIDQDNVVTCADLAIAEQNARVMSSTCDQVRIVPVGEVLFVKGSEVKQ